MFDKIIEKYDLFIFDLDDTLVKSEKMHYQSWLKTLQNNLDENYFISENEYFRIFHSLDPLSVKNFLMNLLKIDDCNEVMNFKNKIYFQMINEKKEEIKMIDGAVEFIENIVKFDKEFIIVSNALKEQVFFFIDLFPILKLASKVYYRELFENKKPNPECYLKVINDFPNKRKVGFEDSTLGIQAITIVKEIDTYFIKNSDYFYYQFILDKYFVHHIQNYYNLE